MRQWNKVFEIGSPRTGTSSLGWAYEILGLKHKGWDSRLYHQCSKGDFKKALEEAEKFDAFEDGPWHDFGLYKALDRKFPNSKFILLERDIPGWIKSHEYFFSADKMAYGPSPIHNYKAKKQKIIESHLEKYREIREYFKNRPNDLLVMNICAGEGWEKLCPFLGFPMPDEKFPHLNKKKTIPLVKKALKRTKTGSFFVSLASRFLRKIKII